MFTERLMIKTKHHGSLATKNEIKFPLNAFNKVQPSGSFRRETLTIRQANASMILLKKF
jgi:hypothetical protein